MDKNIAALLREDTRTVGVVFDQIIKDFDDFDDEPAAKPRQPLKPAGAKDYTYVTNLPLAVGDTVVVEARGLLTLAWVRRVDDDVKIEPNSDTTFKWVIAQVDLAGHTDNLRRNEEIERTVAEAYRHNMRRSFAQQILSGVDDAHRDNLQKLLGSKLA
jgi:hypothetical protein